MLWRDHRSIAGDERPSLQAIFQQVPIELDHYPAVVARAVRSIRQCRTAALGGHVAHCQSCDYVHYAYHSCRNRHCPQCQSRASEQWVRARLRHMLPAPYFHIVFTLPHQLNPLIASHPALLYRLLFDQTSQTLKHFARRYLKGKLGITMVLHTWGQNLSQHVHVHCIVTAGALTDEGQWKAARGDYLFPVKAIRRWFRRRYLDGLKRLHDQLTFTGEQASRADFATFNRWLTPLYQKTWSVYFKKPLANPQRLLQYLARYTHRTAISDSRIVSFDGLTVRFRWKDYRHNNQVRIMPLPVGEFIRRFLQHVLPKRFVRIRHYGLHANFAAYLRERARAAISAESETQPKPESLQAYFLRIFQRPFDRCPRCNDHLFFKKLRRSTARGPPDEPQAI